MTEAQFRQLVQDLVSHAMAYGIGQCTLDQAGEAERPEINATLASLDVAVNMYIRAVMDAWRQKGA